MGERLITKIFFGYIWERGQLVADVDPYGRVAHDRLEWSWWGLLDDSGFLLAVSSTLKTAYGAALEVPPWPETDVSDRIHESWTGELEAYLTENETQPPGPATWWMVSCYG